MAKRLTSKDFETERYRKETIERLFSFREIKYGDCWIFRGTQLRAGYGILKFKGDNIHVNRLSMHLFKDFDLSDNRFILHKCNRPSCFNPDHLYIGDAYDNMQDRLDAGNHNHASKTHCSICGLPLSGDNLYKMPKGGRSCINCINRRSREYKQRKLNDRL